MMTNEIAYKLGYWDAYFMGSPDTNFDYIQDAPYAMYMTGYYAGLEQYAKDHKEAV